MKTLIRFSTIAMILALLLCVAGCGKEASAAATTKATQTPTQSSEEIAPAPSEETAEPTQDAPATEAPETSAPSGTTEQPTGTTEQPSAEDTLDYDELVYEDEEFLLEEDFGTGPLVTVTWATYETMNDAEKAAYRACFSNDRAFEEWSEMAFMIYESDLMDDELWEYTSLNLKSIVEYLTGETFA